MSSPNVERVGVRELRQHASRYIALAEAGTVVEVTRHGRLAARLVAAQDDPQDALAGLVRDGTVEPPRETGNVLGVSPGPRAGGRSVSAELRRMRDDERW